MEYKIAIDLKCIRELLCLSQEEIAKEIGVEPITIVRTENMETYPTNDTLNKIYDFAFNKQVRLNLIKEMFYEEELRKNHKLLFHGAKSEIVDKINTTIGREKNVFGRGFYCGESYEQAISFVSTYDESCVYILDFNPENLSNIKYDVNRDWMLTIAYFRGRLTEYQDHPMIQALVKRIKNVDYIVAPIADNRMFQIIDSFIDGVITDEQCMHCLAATNLGYQYVFISNKAVNQLEILERCFISTCEKKYYQQIRMDDGKIGEDKVRLATIQYRGKGQYIDELLK